MGFGFFGKYMQKKVIQSIGYWPGFGTERIINSEVNVYPQFSNIPTILEYDSANTGNAPEKQFVLTEVNFNQADARGYHTSTLNTQILYPYDKVYSTAYSQYALYYKWLTQGSIALSPSRKVTHLIYRPDLVRYFEQGELSGTEERLQYYPNAKACVVSTNGYPTITGMWPPLLESVFIVSKSIIPPFPRKLKYIYAQSCSFGSQFNQVFANTVLLERLMLAQILNDTANNRCSFGTNITLELTHCPNVRILILPTASIVQINESITALEYLFMEGMSALDTNKFVKLLNIAILTIGVSYINVYGGNQRFIRNIDNADIASTLVKLILYGNQIIGNISANTAKATLSLFRTGNFGEIKESGDGKLNNGVTAGAATLEYGGAGGNGGNNANGSNASTAANNYGGGGGGAGTSGVARNGGNGQQGLIRLTYTTGGVLTKTVLTTSGNFLTPSDVTSMFIESWGGGGGGAGRGSAGQASGGGGGAYSADWVTVLSSTIYPYTIGTGGAGGAGAQDGANGGDTYWDAGLAVKAAGGKGGLQTGVATLGGAVADCIGQFKNRGGNVAANTLVNIGTGGGGGAGNTGTKNYFKTVNVSGVTNATTIDLSNSSIEDLTLPVNTVCTGLYLGGNRLDITVNPNLVNQIKAMTALVSLYLGNNSTLNSQENGQDSINGFGNNLDISILTLLTTLYANNCKLGGQLTIPSNLNTLNIVGNSNLLGIAGTSVFTLLKTIFFDYCTSFTFDFTRLRSLRQLTCSFSGIVTIDMSNLNAVASTVTCIGFWANDNANLVSITWPTNSLYAAYTSNLNILLYNCPVLTTLNNIEQIYFPNISSNHTVNFTTYSSALNTDLKIGINGFLPTHSQFQNNGMSLANVNLNFWNVINNRTKWNIITVTSKIINAAGTNAAPSGIYAAPTGFRLHAELTVTAVSKANPGVVTVSSIGTVTNGDVVYFYSVVGMTELNGNYYKVAGISGNTFQLQTPGGVNVDTTLFGTFTSGKCRPDGDLSGGIDTKAGIYVLVNQYLWTITMN